MDTPSSRIVAAAQATVAVTDEEGRRIEVRRLGALDKLRLFKAAGPQLSQNAPWLGMALLASSVTSLDGIPVPQPASEAGIEALVSRLGDAGLRAVADALQGGAETAPVDAVSAGN